MKNKISLEVLMQEIASLKLRVKELESKQCKSGSSGCFTEELNVKSEVQKTVDWFTDEILL